MIGAIDIGGTKIAVGIVDASGKILARRTIPTANAIGPDSAVALIFQMLQLIQLQLHGCLLYFYKFLVAILQGPL